MIRRILMATINADHPQRGMEHAFKAIFGAENVRVFDYLARRRGGAKDAAISAEFVRHVQEFKPDWVWLQLQMTGAISGSAIMEARRSAPGCVFSHWMGDMRREIAPYLAEVSRACHLTLCSSEGQIPSFLGVGAPEVAYCQIGVDWEEDVMGIPDWKPPFRVPEVVFCGTNYGGTFPGTADREAAAKALLAAKIDFAVVGTGWKTTGIRVAGISTVKQQRHIYLQAKVAINVNNFNDVPRYYSDRLLIAMASGRPVVTKYIPGLEKDFQHGVHCLWYHRSEELVVHVRALLADEALRSRIGLAGRAEVLARHTWFSRILDVLPRVEAIAESKS